MKNLIKKLSPPILIDIYISIKSKSYGWKGDYPSWEDAQKDAVGYDSIEILEKVKNSLLKVKNGEAVYERDSVLFDEVQYSWPLLSGLMFAAAKSHGKLNVLDFGGSLGSTYYQNKKFLDNLDDVHWNIVEQKHFVDVGKKEFEDERLKFFYNIDECMEKKKPNVLVLSSVLQYMEKPYALLEELLVFEFEFLIIDLTPVSLKKRELLTIQKVNPSIYNAKYPCWILDSKKLEIVFSKYGYEKIEEFKSLNGFEVKNEQNITIGKYIGEIRIKNDKKNT